MEQIAKSHCSVRLDRLPDCRWHASMFVTVAFGLLVCWSNAVGGLILAQLKEFGWADNSTTTTFSAITTAGMFLGAFGGGTIGDKTERRNAFTLYEAIHIVSMTVGAFSPNMTFLIACRFVVGVGLGALLVILFTGFTEYTPGRNRGTWSGRISFIGNWSYPLCPLIAVGLMPLISVERNWRVQLTIPAVLSLVAAVIAWCSFLESPRWLESRGYYAEAEKVIRAIGEGVVQQTDKLLPPVVFEDDSKALCTIPYSVLSTGVLLKRVILGSFILIVTNVVQHTLINWLPTTSMIQGTNLKDSIVLNVASMFGAPFGILIAMLVMDKVPRKTMDVGLLVLVAVLGYTYSLRTSTPPITLVGFFLITFVYMYICYASVVHIPEVWLTEVKFRGSGLANAVGRTSGAAVPYVVMVLFNGHGVTGVFILLGAVPTIVAVTIVTIGIETKGVSVKSPGIDAVTSK